MDEHHPQIWSKFGFGVLTMAALLPFLAASFGTAAIPQGRALSGVRHLPSLVFRQYAVNLREVPAVGPVTAPFSFFNRGDRPVEIVKLEPSCGCLAPRLLGNRRVYPPDAQGLFEVQVDTAREQPGPHSYTVRVHYHDGQPRTELVTFRLRVPERKVTVDPPELYFYQLSGSPLSGEVQIQDRRGRHLRVLSATTSLPALTVEVGQQSQMEGDVSTTPIQVHLPGSAGTGTKTGVIVIRTDDDDYPVIRVPVFVQGPEAPVQLTSGIVPEPPAPRQGSGTSAPSGTGSGAPP